MKNKILFVCNRCVILYLICGGIFYFGVNHRKITFKIFDSMKGRGAHLYQDTLNNFNTHPAQIRDVITYYKEIIKILPEASGAYSVVGYCYYRIGDYNRAVKHYQMAVGLDPEQFVYYHNLGLIYFELGQYDKAAGVLQQAVKQHPKLKQPDRIASAYRTKGGKMEKGRDAELFELKAGYAEAYKVILLSQLLSGDREGARQTAAEGLAKSPFKKEIFYNFETLTEKDLLDMRRESRVTLYYYYPLYGFDVGGKTLYLY